MLVNGSTAIDGLSGRGGEVRSPAGPAPSAILNTRTGLAMFLSSTSPMSSKTMVALAAQIRRAPWPRRRCRPAPPCLQPRGYVDAVAVDVRSLADDVAEIDADAQNDAPILAQEHVGLGHVLLQLERRLAAFTALANSISTPSPMTLTIRPSWPRTMAPGWSSAAPSARRAFPPRPPP